MTRKFLEELRLEKEVIDKILDENSSDIGKAKGDLDSAKSENKTLKEQVAERDKQFEELKKSTGDSEALKKQIETLQSENKTKDETHAAELLQLKVDTAVTSALTASKAKNLVAVRALLDLTKAELSDDGKVKGLEDQIKKLVEGEETKFLFETATKPKFKGFNPGEPKDKEPVDGKPQSFNTLADAVKIAMTPDD